MAPHMIKEHPGFSPGRNEGNAVPMLFQSFQPSRRFVTVERRIEPHAAKPRLAQTVVLDRVVMPSRIPRTHHRGARIQIKLAKPLKDPRWRQPLVGLADSPLLAV